MATLKNARSSPSVRASPSTRTASTLTAPCAVQACQYNKQCHGCESLVQKHSRLDLRCKDRNTQWHPVNSQDMIVFWSLASDSVEKEAVLCHEHYLKFHTLTSLMTTVQTGTVQEQTQAVEEIGLLCQWISENRAKILLLGGFEKLLNLMKTQNEDLRERCIYALKNLSKGETHLSVVIITGAVQQLLPYLSANSNFMRAHAAAVLWHFALSPTAEHLLQTKTVIDEVLACFMRCNAEDETSLFCLGILWAVSTEFTLHSQLIRDPFLASIFNILQGPSSKLQHNAIGLACNLLRSDALKSIPNRWNEFLAQCRSLSMQDTLKQQYRTLLGRTVESVKDDIVTEH
eukprot:GILK01010416.1.p1 GENE.GILK01010416.1~~GILK01010416.1.p1  ORF type:complete len:345 (-),score=38.77 GILK01010416.1:385-1419(-)